MRGTNSESKGNVALLLAGLGVEGMTLLRRASSTC
jgi:hypothetical protein